MRQSVRSPLSVELLESRDLPSTITQSFDTTTPPALPSGWNQWSNDGSTAFGTVAGQGVGGSVALASSGGSQTAALAWQSATQSGDTGVSAQIDLNSLTPTFVLARGTNLGSSAPSYLAAEVTRGATVSLVQVSNGASRTLATIASPPSAYLSGQWVQISLTPSGSAVSVQVVREDTGQYLNAQGTWQTGATNALSGTTSLADVASDVGLGRAADFAGTVDFDNFAIALSPPATVVAVPPTSPPPVATSPPPVATATSAVSQTFDATAVGAIPSGWQTWGSNSAGTAGVSSAVALSQSNSFALGGASNTAERAWSSVALPAAVSATVAIDLNSLIPTQLFVGGVNLYTSTPTYDAIQVSRGMQASLIQVVDGTTTTLGTLSPSGYLSGTWVQVELTAQGTSLLASIYRTDTDQWLNASGAWSSTPAYAFNIQNAVALSAGLAGIGRSASYSGTVNFDNFSAGAVGTVGSNVSFSTSPGSGTVSGNETFQATATGNLQQIAFVLGTQLEATSATSPASWTLNSSTLANGTYTLTVLAGGSDGTVGSTSYTFSTSNTVASPPVSPPTTSPPASPPTYPKYPIEQLAPSTMIAELAYNGTTIGATETQLLQNDVDLVVSSPTLMSQINSINSNASQLLYTNVSNLYETLLVSWENYAVANGIDPEAAFYHVAQPTAFTGNSASSQPVDWFWGVFQSALASSTLTDLTSASYSTTASGFSMGAAGHWTAVGYPEEFNMMNFSLATPAASGWSGVWQYVTAVNASGSPTAWSNLPINDGNADGTSGLTKSGTIMFDPPSNWVPAAVQSGGEKLYYVRFLVTSGTAAQAPTVRTLLGDDYTDSNGTDSGVIPAFDYAADADGDGYLDPQEYADRTPGDNAYFAYQSRLFYPSYGQMRFVTDPGSTAFQQWAAQYAKQLLAQYPLADGLFLDNETGALPFSGISVVESTADYSQQSAALVSAIESAVGSKKLVMVNAAGGGTQSADVAAAADAVFEESLLRPLASTWSQVGDTTNLVDTLLASPNDPYLVLDSLPTGGSPTDPRTELATLAYYYLYDVPGQTMLMFYGGYSPSTSWTQHWTAAAAANIGTPTAAMQVVASGNDPENTALKYEVFGRSYSNGLVLYKPLSYKQGVGTGTLDASTATTVQLNGSYQQVNANGTLGPVVTSVSLMNGQGAVFVKA